MPAGRRAGWLAVAVGVVAAVVIVAVAGNQAARSTRVLGQLDVVFDLLRASCAFLIPWLDTNATRVGAVVTAVAVILALAAWLSARRKVTPIAWFAASLILATWGEVLVLSDKAAPGVGLFGLAVASAALLGSRYPLPARDSWMAADRVEPSDAIAVWEYYLVGGLTFVALITRLYGLNETPNNFENEMILGMLSSRSLFGVFEFGAFSLTSNTNGFVHLFLQLLTYDVFDTSVFSLRLTGALWTTATVPIFYWLLRRIGGVGAAVIGTMLLISAPEQLFWSRSETVCVALLAPVAIVTVALCVRLLRGAHLAVLLALVLWIPLSRFFYSPAIVLPFFCLLVYVHSLLFVRGAWRTTLRVLPAFALGFWLWVYSLSAAYAVFSNGTWQFINPAQSGGALVWRGEGGRGAASASGLLVAQATTLAKNLQHVSKAAAYSTSFDGWYRRDDPSSHPTLINVAIVVAVAVGIGYLLGQLRDPRAFALLAWVGIGLMPGLLSLDPAPRRMGLAFPGLYAVIALTFAAGLDFYKARVRRGVTLAAQAVVGVGLGVVAWTSMGSHFLLPMKPTYLDEVRRASQAVFAESDVVLYTLAPFWGEILSFVHGDEVFRDDRVTCIQKISSQDFLSAALMQTCQYEDSPFRFALAPERREALRSTNNPQSISFLVGEYGMDVAHQQLLRALFPAAKPSPLRVAGTGFNVEWFRVDRASAEALRSPILRSAQPDGAALATQLLAGVSLTPTASPEGSGITVEGGMLIAEEGWYTIAVEPACDAASLEIDEQRRAGSEPFALTAGVHGFKLALPSASACSLPLGFRTQRFDRVGMIAVAAPALVAPSVVALDQARGRALVSDTGFKEARPAFVEPGVVFDIGADAEGTLVILRDEGGTRKIRRVLANGREDGIWPIDGDVPVGMSVAPDGTVFVVYPDRVTLYGRAGEPMRTWKNSVMRTAAVGHLANGDVLSPLVNNGAVAVVDRDGKLLRTWNSFEGGPGKFGEPASVGVNAAGDVLVIELDGTALLFHTPADHFEPTFVRSFRVEFRNESAVTGGWAFDGADRVIIPEPGFGNAFIYQLDGARVMARSPQLDFSYVIGDLLRRVVVTNEGVYTLDGARRLRRFVRVADADQT